MAICEYFLHKIVMSWRKLELELLHVRKISSSDGIK